MNRHLRLPSLLALLPVLLAACSGSGGIVPAASTHGVMTGSYFRHAKVCLDANRNGRCDSGEAATFSDRGGTFSLPGGGDIVAEIGAGATRIDPDTNTERRLRTRWCCRHRPRPTGW